MEKRIGAVAIIVKDISKASKINTVMSEHSDVIIGRMGIPRPEKNIQIISLIIEGDTDRIGSLTGKLGRIEGIEVKSVLTRFSEGTDDNTTNTTPKEKDN